MKFTFIQNLVLRFCSALFVLSIVCCSCNRTKNSIDDKSAKATVEGKNGKIYPQIAPSLFVSGSSLEGPAYTVPLGTQVTVGAIFTPANNRPNMSGAVTIKYGDKLLCSRTLTATSNAAICSQTQFYNAGTYDFYLNYEGNENYETLVNAEFATLNVTKAIPTMVLKSTAQSSVNLGTPIELTVSVDPPASPAGLPVAVGKVQITDRVGSTRTVICKGNLTDGQFTCKNIVLKPEGVHRLNIHFNGDINYYPVSSDNAQTIKVTKVTP